VTVVFPQSVPAEGAINIVFVPSIADPEAPSAAVVGGATAVDLSCYITAGGFSIDSSQAEIEDRRFCSVESSTQPGRVTRSFGDMTFVYNPQAEPADPENEAYETLAPGTQGFLVSRWGLPVDTAWAADQIVDVAQVTWGDRRKNLPDDTEGAVLTATTRPFVSSHWDDVALVA
jgi:hypothetical protein